jgi:hypothetical protein
MYRNTKNDIYKIVNMFGNLNLNKTSFLGRKNTDVEFSSVEEYLLAYILKKEIAELAKIERRHGYLSVEEFNRKEKLTRKLRDILFTLVTFIGADEVKHITDLRKNPGFINKINASRDDIIVLNNDVRNNDVIRVIYDNTVLPYLEDVIKNTEKVVDIVIGKAKVRDPGPDVRDKIVKYLKVPVKFSRKSARKPRKSAKQPKKPRKPRKSVRKPRKSVKKSARKPRKSVRKPRKSARKSRKSARKSARKPRKSVR